MKEVLGVLTLSCVAGAYFILVKPAINVAKLTIENGYSIKNFVALL